MAKTEQTDTKQAPAVTLVVREPFLTYLKGDMIKAASEIEAALKDFESHVVKVLS